MYIALLLSSALFTIGPPPDTVPMQQQDIRSPKTDHTPNYYGVVLLLRTLNSSNHLSIPLIVFAVSAFANSQPHQDDGAVSLYKATYSTKR